jgi:secreted trypsin-like serine protease
MGFWVQVRRGRLWPTIGAVLFMLAASLAPAWGVLAAESGRGVGEEVVGGQPVPDGKYPFMVSVQYGSFGSFSRRCGGMLLSPTKVLSAAHCFDNRSPANYQVVVGVTVLSSEQGQVRSVKEVAVHPRYTRGGDFRFDAAVLTLKVPVEKIPLVTPAGKSDDHLERPGTAVTTAGWGSTRRVEDPNSFSRPRYPDRMHEVRLRVVADTDCQAAYANLARRNSGYKVDPALMLCAAKDGADSCQGDSGGPLFEKVGTRFVQVGIVSFGYGCAAKGYPGVYTRVSAPEIRDFIRRQL